MTQPIQLMCATMQHSHNSSGECNLAGSAIFNENPAPEGGIHEFEVPNTICSGTFEIMMEGDIPESQVRAVIYKEIKDDSIVPSFIDFGKENPHRLPVTCRFPGHQKP